MKPETVLIARELTKKIGSKTLVNHLSFETKAGEIVGLLGPNGAGKTTTMRMLVGMISASEGEVEIKGFKMKNEFHQAMEHVGVIIESPEFYKYLTGYENLKYFARMHKNVGKERINEVVELLGLKFVIHRKVSGYSLGMRQRLGIAQALLHRPSVLILDEPTNGLDPAGIREMRDYMKDLAHNQGISVLVSSHLLTEVELMCDRVIIIQEGKFIASQDLQSSTMDYARTLEIKVNHTEKACTLLANFSIDTPNSQDSILVNCHHHDIPKIIKKLSLNEIDIFDIVIHKKSLEDTFLELTGGKDIV